MQFSFQAGKVERALSHLVPSEQSLSLLFKCVVTETDPRAAGASESPICKRSDFPLSKRRKSLVGLSCPRHHVSPEQRRLS